MNEQIDVNVEKLQPFTKILMTIGQLPTSYLMSMTYYEQLIWFTKYLQETVIPTINNNADAVTEVQQIVMDLQTYINNYFDNLDVQQEINNKLDEMATDGSLTNLIKNYVDPIQQAFETTINSEINEINIKVDNIASGSPLVASSTSEMTDTTRVYVNTTDGKWYYYNGSAWTIGGTYQSTAIADDSVNYNNLTQNLKETNYREIHAEDIVWFQGIGCYNGTVTNDSATFSSQIIRLSKGSSINIANTIKVRITQFALDKTFIRHTGSYATLTNPWVADRDCFVRVSIASVDSETPLTYADITNENISLTALKENNYNNLVLDNLTFTRVPDHNGIVQSNPIYCGKNTKISISELGFLNSGGTSTLFPARFGIRPSNVFASQSSSSETTQYTTNKDGFIIINIKFTNPSTTGEVSINDSMLTNIKNLINIELTQYNNINSLADVYVSSNREIKTVINYDNSGANLIRINGVVIHNFCKVIADLTIDDIETQLSSNVVEYNGENYIRIPSYRMLAYDLRESTLKIIQILQYERPYNGDDLINLATNSYGFFYDGKIIEQKARQQIASIQTTVDNNIVNIFNSGTVSTSYDWKTKAKEFCELFNDIDSTNIESFVFFTDQHLMGNNDIFDEDTMKDYITKLQKMYNSTPTSYIVSGGDWLNNQDTQENACFKLGYVDGFMNSMFKDFYPINGNHDTNYQGVINPGEVWTGELSTDTETNLSFRKYGKMYYKFAGNKSMNYVLDTQLDINDSMTTYKWEQIDWLANELISDDPEHATVLMHIVWRINDPVSIGLLADNATKLIYSYNTHSSTILNGQTYDFTNCTGHVDYVLSGHTHLDKSDTINNVLCIATTNFKSGNVPTYDIVLNDYDNGKVYMIRVGNGSNRTFNI